MRVIENKTSSTILQHGSFINIYNKTESENVN